MEVVGSTDLRIGFIDQKGEAKTLTVDCAVVENLGQAAFLGMDFLFEAGAVIDPQQQRISYQGQPARENCTGPILKASESKVVNPRSQTMIAFQPSSPVTETLVVESRMNRLRITRYTCQSQINKNS